MHTKPVASSSNALIVRPSGDVTIHVHGVVSTELPLAIEKGERNRVVELIDQEPRLIEQLDEYLFEQALSCVLQSSHAKATDVYQRLLKAPQMQNLSQLRLDLQAMDFTETPEVIERLNVSAEDLLFRLNCFLATEHAKKVDPLRLRDLYQRYLETNRDTTRLVELMTPAQKTQIDDMIKRDKATSTSRWWCSLV